MLLPLTRRELAEIDMGLRKLPEFRDKVKTASAVAAMIELELTGVPVEQGAANNAIQ